MAQVSIDGNGAAKGFNSHVIDLAIKDMGGKPTKVYDLFGGSVGRDRISIFIKDFLADAEKNPSKAAE